MRFTLALASLALAGLAACGGSGVDCATSPTANGCTGGSTGGTSAPFVGSYTLQLVDGKPLPGVSPDSSILSGTLVVTDSGWKQTTVVKYVAGGSGNPNGDTLSMAGGWLATSSTITLQTGNSDVYAGTYTSSTITLTTKTATILGYTKQ